MFAGAAALSYFPKCVIEFPIALKLVLKKVGRRTLGTTDDPL
jgi:hypothetical protein